MSSPFIFFSDVDQYPVWILSTTSSGAPSVFQGDLLWWNPCIVRYECDNSFEVVEAPESRLKPKTGDDEPTPWGTVSWESIRNQCFRGEPPTFQVLQQGWQKRRRFQLLKRAHRLNLRIRIKRFQNRQQRRPRKKPPKHQKWQSESL